MWQLSCISCLLLCMASAAQTEVVNNRRHSLKLRLVSGAPVLDAVYINGRGPYSFVLDTGAQTSLISIDLARDLSLPAAFRSTVVTQTHEVVRDGFRADRIRIGDLEATNESFIAGSFTQIRKLDRAIQGSLGQSFLSKLDYLIDFRHRAITFGSAPTPGGTRTTFGLTNGCMVANTSQGQLTLDSGASTVVLYDPREVRWTGEVAMNTVEGQTRVRFGALRLLRVAGQEFHNVEVSAAARAKLDESESDGLLPASLFRSVYVSNSGGYVIFNAEQ